MMPWSFLFVIGLAQGVFLFVVFARRPGANRLATRLLQVLLALFALSNFDDLLLATGGYRSAPAWFGFSLGAMFAYGPLFYLYLRAVTDPAFCWRRTTGLHLLPAALNLLWNLSWLTLPAAIKIRILDDFLAGRMRVRAVDAALSIVQILHLAVYLALAWKIVERTAHAPDAGAFQVPMPRRVAWLRRLMVLFSLILFALIALLAWNCFLGYYAAGANYGFTVITSAILYFMAYQLMLQPELVAPGFAQKYQSQRPAERSAEEPLQQLGRLLEEEKVFTDPELKVSTLAARLGIPPHRLSMLINNHYGVPFNALINRYRVEEFLRRLNDPRFAHYTLHGLALEVGFNSKSAFNTAFKKITGKTPSDFKRNSAHSPHSPH